MSLPQGSGTIDAINDWIDWEGCTSVECCKEAVMTFCRDRNGKFCGERLTIECGLLLETERATKGKHSSVPSMQTISWVAACSLQRIACG